VGGIVGGILSHRRKTPIMPAAATTSGTATMSGTATALSNYLFPTPISWGYPHLEVLALSDNQSDSVFWKWRDLNSSETEIWQPTDGSLEAVGGTAAPFDNGVAAIARGVGFVDLFITGNDNHLYHKYHDDSGVWQPVGLGWWEPHLGTLVTAPSVVSWDEQRLDVFAISAGPPFGVSHIYWNESGWSPWLNIGGNWSTFTPTAVSWGINRLDLFLVDPIDKHLYHKYWDGDVWQPSDSFENLGGYCTSRVTTHSGLLRH
jgi:hypothetical protein